MQSTMNTTVPTLSRPPSFLLNIANTYSLSITNSIPLQIDTNLNATANQCPTLFNHPETNTGPSASLPPSSSNVNRISLSSVSTQNVTVPFVAVSKSVKVFDRLAVSILMKIFQTKLLHT